MTQEITALLQQLTQQIGTTVDTIFPWYVQQAQMSAWATLVTLLIVIIGSTCLISIFAYLGKKTDEELFMASSVISFILLMIALLVSALASVDIYTGITNPEYHAVHKLLMDLSQIK